MDNRVRNVLKKLTAVAMALFMLGGQLVMPDAPGMQTAMASDTSGHWAEPYMQKLNQAEVMYGDNYGNMNPDRPITRAEFVSMINRAFNYNNPGTPSFKDVSDNAWYANDIAIAYEMGYFTGESKTQAKPENYLTREQAVTFLTRNIKYDSIPLDDYDAFTDSWGFNEWSRDAINIATSKNFISGYNDGSFRPGQNITRGETAKLLSTAAGELINTAGEKSLGYTPGNVMVSKSGATLRNTTIGGDLYITAGVGLGETRFENVVVNGEVIIMGAGASNAGTSSVVFKDSQIKKMTIDGPEDQQVAVKVDGTTEVKNVIVKSDAIIEELSNNHGGVRNVEMRGKEEDSLWLQGIFDKVTVKAPKQFLHAGSGEIMELVIDEEATESEIDIAKNAYVSKAYVDVSTNIIGNGEIGYIKINALNTKVAGLPDAIDITPGYTASINGQVMDHDDGLVATARPKILSKYPEVEQIGSTQATAVAKTNKDGTIYWAVTEKGSNNSKVSRDEIEKPDQVKSIVKSGSAAAKEDTEIEQEMSGLKQDTEYIVSMFMIDKYDVKSSVETESFKTGDTTKPAFVSGYPKLNSTTDVTADIDVIVDKNTTVHWAVYEQGRKAPTADELKKGKYDGSIASGTVSCKKNEVSTVTVSGLQEVKQYDFYAMATDGDNDSGLGKLNFSTRDVTPPNFVDPYPRSDKVTPNSVVVQYKTDEDATIYYIALKRGTEFPPTPEGETTQPDINSDIAKQLIMTGNNALKNGTGTAKADTEGSVTVNGLEPETSYDVYLVAEDKSKNLSVVKSLTVRTTDTIAPTVTQEFLDMVDEVPTATTTIRIIFSEEVWDVATRKPPTPESLTASQNIVLYDLSATRKTEVPIDFTQAQIVVEEGKTVIILPDAAIDLKSGNRYQFQINNIVDTVGNKMVNKTLLPEFTTIAPLVQLVKTNPTEDPRIDMTFRMEPQSNDTADDIKFDMYFYTDTGITFHLWQKIDGEWKVLTTTGAWKSKDELTAGDKLEVRCWNDTGVSLYTIIDKQANGGGDWKYVDFNQLEDTEYGIEVASIKSDTDRTHWNTTINMEVRCLMGASTYLNVAAQQPTQSYEQAIRLGAVEVHYPKDFSLMATFMDIAAPKFLTNYPHVGTVAANQEQVDNPLVDYYNMTQVGDNAARISVSTDKACTVHYLVVPQGKVLQTPTAEQLINKYLSPADGIYGTEDISSGGVEMPIDVSNLIPGTNYDAYLVLKGTADEPSEVVTLKFRTYKAYAPIMTWTSTSYPNSGKQATINFKIDKTAEIHWVVYIAEKSHGPQEAEIIANPDYIRESMTNPGAYNVIDSGSLKSRVGPGEDPQELSVTVDGLEQNMYYTFYAVAKSELSEYDSKILIVRDMTPTDMMPPEIQVRNQIAESDMVVDPDRLHKPFSGIVELEFNEYAYYYKNYRNDGEQGEQGEVFPLTIKAFKDPENLKISILGGDAEVDPAQNGGTTRTPAMSIVAYTTRSGSSRMGTARSDEPIKNITIKYTTVSENASITFNKYICDKGHNVAGYLTLVFRDNASKDDPDSRRGGSTAYIKYDNQNRVFVEGARCGFMPQWRKN